MPDATTDSFLEGQGIPVDLRHIETELAKLWGPAAEQVGGPELENPHVTRIVLANLVVECLDGDGESLGPVLETVIARFPCRAIVVRGSDDPDRRIDGRSLGALPPAGAGAAAGLFRADRAPRRAERDRPGSRRGPSVARGRLADGPLVDRRPADARAALSRPGRRVLASGPRPARPGAEAGALRLGLDPSLCPCSRDSAWFGLARWRELVAQFFDPPCHADSLRRIDSGADRGPVARSDPTAPAGDLAGGLAGRSAWLEAARSTRLNTAGDSRVRVWRRDSSARPATWPVDIVTRPIPAGLPASTRLVGVDDHDPDDRRERETFRLRRPAPDSPAVLVEAEPLDSCCLPRVIDAPELDPAPGRRRARIVSRRPPFQKALPIAPLAAGMRGIADQLTAIGSG